MILPPNTAIAVGPVIIEDGKVLLNREQKVYGVSPWFFPGGEVETYDASLENTCRREVQEEMGIDVELVRPLRTIIDKQSNGGVVILAHYLAKRHGEIIQAPNITEWGWHDIRQLPPNCAPNVHQIISDILQDNIML